MSDDNEHFDLDLGELGDGPAHRPLEDRLGAGRRALWRRRAGTGLASVAVIAVVGTTFALVSGPGAPTGGNDSSTVADGGPEVPVPVDEMCSVPGATGSGTSGSSGSGTTKAEPPTTVEPVEPIEPPDADDDPNDPGADPDLPVYSEAPVPGTPATDLPFEPVPDVVCCAAVPVPVDPALEPPLPPDGTIEPGTVEPDRDSQSGTSSGSDASTGAEDGVQTDPAPGDAPTASAEPVPGIEPEPDLGAVDCGAFPDEGVSSGGGTAWGSSDGVLGGTHVGPLGQDETDAGPDTGQLADLTSEGELVLADGVEDTDRVENPLGLVDPDHSLAVEVTDGDGARTWLLLTFTQLGENCGEWAFTSTPATKGSSLQDWVDDTSVTSGPYASDKPACAVPAGATSGSVGKP